MDTARNMWVTEGTELLAVTDNGRLAGVLTHHDFEAQQLFASLLGDHIGDLVMDIAEQDQMFFGHRGAYMMASAGALSGS